MNLIIFLGTLATTGSLLVASLGIFSQIRKNFKTKTCGIDPLYASLILCSYALWTIYSIFKKDLFIFIPHLVGMFLASIVIWQYRKYGIKKRVIKPISEGKRVAISATNGTETLASANDIFTYISPDFKNWGCDKVEPETPEVDVKIYEQVKDATYAEIFGSIDQNLDRLVLTTSQIKSFIMNNAKDYFLDAEWTCFRFLFKVDDEFFVADVRVLANGERAVRVFKFLDGSVRHAEYRHRIVVRL